MRAPVRSQAHTALPSPSPAQESRPPPPPPLGLRAGLQHADAARHAGEGPDERHGRHLQEGIAADARDARAKASAAPAPQNALCTSPHAAFRSRLWRTALFLCASALFCVLFASHLDSFSAAPFSHTASHNPHVRFRRGVVSNSVKREPCLERYPRKSRSF
eukprot:5239699-Pleurochrysis_carterae.AAC.1